MSQLTAAIFRDGYVIEHVALDAGIPQYGSSEFIWIEVLDPEDADFAVLEDRFGLPSLAVEDSMRPEQIPKVDLYDDQIFVVLKVARLEGDAIVYGEIDAFVSPHHIITICRTAGSGHAHARERFQSGPKLTQARPDFACTASWTSSSTAIFRSCRWLRTKCSRWSSTCTTHSSIARRSPACFG